MGHRIPNHESKCRHLHGHRYTLELTLVGPLQGAEGRPDQGMVIDFGAIKEQFQPVIDALDHKTLIYQDDTLARVFTGEKDNAFGVILVGYIPTVEEITMMLFDAAWQIWSKQVASVKVWETPNCFAEVKGAGVWNR
jgi:6-pyruvoyltetrahydropterin/6-carboxytetrahydropterin synthase